MSESHWWRPFQNMKSWGSNIWFKIEKCQILSYKRHLQIHLVAERFVLDQVFWKRESTSLCHFMAPMSPFNSPTFHPSQFTFMIYGTRRRSLYACIVTYMPYIHHSASMFSPDAREISWNRAAVSLSFSASPITRRINISYMRGIPTTSDSSGCFCGWCKPSWPSGQWFWWTQWGRDQARAPDSTSGSLGAMTISLASAKQSRRNQSARSNRNCAHPIHKDF